MPSGAGDGKRSVSPPPAEPRLESPPLSVSPAVFQKFQKLIYGETGIWLGTSKTALLCGRLYRRLVALGIPSLESYYDCVSSPDGHEERARMIDAITTNETRFFREPRQFEFIVQQVLPRLRAEAEQGLRPKRVRIWSAGCSSGEEPYTLAMLLAEHLPAENGWDTRILATDISNRMLEKARSGVYDLARSVEIPKHLLRRFVLRGCADRQGQMKVRVEIQQTVDFRRLNLNQEPYLIDGPFDAILCRNVLIYFDADSKRRVIANLLSDLAVNGYLFVGHAENLTSISPQLRSVEPTIYTRTQNEADRAAGHSGSSSASSDPERPKANAASTAR
ncbi:MAG TPA: protein-glutamate O-methyltransferase [Terriglobales bacterium]|nr:protein-glutamate O-methyltransferase [Terriglobales bacterium]